MMMKYSAFPIYPSKVDTSNGNFCALTNIKRGKLSFYNVREYALKRSISIYLTLIKSFNTLN